MKLFSLLLLISCMSNAQDWTAFIGTYTRGVSRGIYSLRYEPATGKMAPIGLAAQSVSPSFLAVHPNGKWLYAVNESRRYNGIANSGSVSAFSIDHHGGTLTALNIVPSRGADPCHLTVDRGGHWLFVANYSAGSVSVFPIGPDGALGEAAQIVQHSGETKADPVRQEAPHAHSVDISIDNKLLYVSDLGADQIVVYNFDASTGRLTQRSTAKQKAGSGPRHIAFSRDHRFLYSFDELTSRIVTFRHDASTGAMDELQSISTLPRGFKGPKSGAEIAVEPSGRFLYASNRGHDSIAIFSIDAEQGLLSSVGRVSTQGKSPRHFAIDPEGKHLIVANQDSSNLVAFKIDPDTGGLTPQGEPLYAPEPVCILFVRMP
ncbi:MAG: lactonase family protein [Acidobacteriota bacterium]